MLRSLFTGVTGLRSHSQWLDVIGNNIANVDTVGYKNAGVTFQDLLSQTIQGEVRPSSGQGGVSVKQVGLGVTLGSIRNFFNQGALQQTGNPTDLAVQGDGFFVLSSGADTLYSRAGAFALDANGRLVDSVTGYRVQGASGNVTIAPGSTVAGTATTTEYFKGNLDASVADGGTYAMTFPVYDSLGTSRTITLTFTKNFAAASGRWDWAATESDANITSLGGATGSLIFNTSGAISSGATAPLTVNYAAAAGAATPQVVTLDFGSASNTTPMTGFAGSSTATLASQNGVASGSLQSFTIGPDGSVTGFYSNGTNQVLTTLRLASFANPGGLLKAGANLYKETGNSGTPSLGNPGTGGRGTIASGNLEMSNVDLAQEFTNLIIAQRGFQANTRVITASDEVLQDLVNLIR
jgi:flagellar hook protein FlgE